MTSQFRDTQFGQVVRFLSGEKLLRYPDENDPSLWKQSLRRDKPHIKDDVDLQDKNINQALENGNDIYLIDWYGPDDPEVSAVPSFIDKHVSHESRIHRIGPAAGSCWWAFKSASLTLQYTLAVPFTFQVKQVSWTNFMLARPWQL